MDETPLHLVTPLNGMFTMLHESFVAARAAGFSEDQAIKLIATMTMQGSSDA